MSPVTIRALTRMNYTGKLVIEAIILVGVVAARRWMLHTVNTLPVRSTLMHPFSRSAQIRQFTGIHSSKTIKPLSECDPTSSLLCKSVIASPDIRTTNCEVLPYPPGEKIRMIEGVKQSGFRQIANVNKQALIPDMPIVLFGVGCSLRCGTFP